MAVYSLNGSSASSAYGTDSERLSYAYDIDGNEVVNSRDYDDYTVSDVLFSLSGSGYQGFAVHGGTIAQFQSNDKVSLISIDGTAIASGLECESYHGQSAFFMNDYYAENDEFPLLMVMGSYVNSWINRITRTGTTLVKTIYISTTASNGGYKLGNAYNAENNHMFMFGYTNKNYLTDDGGENKLILSEWNLNNMTDNGDGTFTPELVRTVQRDFIVCIQGSCMHDGLLWASSGVGGAPSHVYVFDPLTFEILHTITLSNTEIEGCAWVDNYLLVGQNPNNIAYRKVTFAD